MEIERCITKIEFLLNHKGSMAQAENELKSLLSLASDILAIRKSGRPKKKEMSTYLGQSDEVDMYRQGQNFAIDKYDYWLAGKLEGLDEFIALWWTDYKQKGVQLGVGIRDLAQSIKSHLIGEEKRWPNQ